MKTMNVTEVANRLLYQINEETRRMSADKQCMVLLYISEHCRAHVDTMLVHDHCRALYGQSEVSA